MPNPASRERPRAAAGWRLTVAAARRYGADRCAQSAAAIAYHVLFSLLPLTIVGVGVLGVLVGDRRIRAHVVDLVVGFVPLTADGRAQVTAGLGELAGLSTLGLLGGVALLWSAGGAMGVARTALDRAWDVTARRPLVRGKLADIAGAASAIVAAGAGVALTVAARMLRDTASRSTWPRPLTPVVDGVAWALSLAVPLAVAAVVFAALYRTVPAQSVTGRSAWTGASVAAAGFELAVNGFSLYVTHFSAYNRVYGSLGAAVAFMVFIYLTASVFLFGAQVAAGHQRSVHRRTAPVR